jgi:hypothetical protein
VFWGRHGDLWIQGKVRIMPLSIFKYTNSNTLSYDCS